jgi:hypothetical protein
MAIKCVSTDFSTKTTENMQTMKTGPTTCVDHWSKTLHGQGLLSTTGHTSVAACLTTMYIVLQKCSDVIQLHGLQLGAADWQTAWHQGQNQGTSL